jgi:pimeloyl-ACP methyl ester carboxylesterase
VHPARPLLVGAVIALFTACTGGGSSEPSIPSFAAARCPRDVDIQLLVRHSCGYLTVRQDRSGSDGRTLALFVVRIPPPDERPRPDPILVLGDDIGAIPDYGGHQAEAARMHRVVYILEQRGVGHSRPELSCPEVDRESTRGLVEPSGDSFIRSRLVAAVRECRSRLMSLGIEPRDFDLPAMAADVEDLRRALRIASWDLAAYGSLSRLALEVIREHPEHVRAVYLDSPQFPQLDEPTEVALGAGFMLNELFRACHADASCRSSHPSLRQTWALAIRGLAANPIEAHTSVGDVLIDTGSFVRAIQADLSEDTAELSRFPGLVADASHRRMQLEVTTALATHGSLCVGYRFRCAAHFSTGVYLTVLCRDEAPFVDPAALQAAVSGTAGLAEAFGTNPYLSACPAWNVAPGPSSIHSPVEASVPVLMLSGQFDPFSPPRLVAQYMGSLANSFVIDVPGLSHNPILGSGCQIGIRDSWIERPLSPPNGTDCLRGVKLEFAPRQ